MTTNPDLTDRLADVLTQIVKGDDEAIQEMRKLGMEPNDETTRLTELAKEALSLYRAQRDGEEEELPDWAIQAAGKIMERISRDSVPTAIHVMGMQYSLAQIIVDEFRRPLAKGEA